MARIKATDDDRTLDLLGDIQGVEVEGGSREAGRAAMARNLLPESTWKPVAELPNWAGAKRVGYDVESHDPFLRTHGPGFTRGDAYVIGIAVSLDDRSLYLPLKHEDGREYNLDPDRCYQWVVDVMKQAEFVEGANLLYDLESLAVESEKYLGQRFIPPGLIQDCQVAEPLLDEDPPSVDLDRLAVKYGFGGKNEDDLRRVASVYGILPKEVKSNLRKISPKYVGPYAETDARLASKILDIQRPQLEKEELSRCFYKESRLTKMLLKMRLQGVPVAVDRAQEAYDRLKLGAVEVQKEVDFIAGCQVDVWSSPSIARACKALGLEHEFTDEGAPSFTKEWLAAQKHVPFFERLLRVRKLERTADTFVRGFILEKNFKGRLYCQFHQLRRDKGEDGEKQGARSGRLSSSNPNLQQVPARDPEFGPLVRGLFVPEDGYAWGCHDYSGQENRVTVDYAYKLWKKDPLKFEGADIAFKAFIDNPKMKYHNWVADLVSRIIGMEFPYAAAKQMNLSIPYGAQDRKIALMIYLAGGLKTIFGEKEYWDKPDKRSGHKGTPIPKEATQIFQQYHGAMPWVKPLMQTASETAETRGFVRTSWGRKARFEEREYKEYLKREVVKNTHKALNRIVQGTSGDMMKEALILLEGPNIIPSLTVHDELDDAMATQSRSKQVHEAMVEAGRNLGVEVLMFVESKDLEHWGQKDVKGYQFPGCANYLR